MHIEWRFKVFVTRCTPLKAKDQTERAGCTGGGAHLIPLESYGISAVAVSGLEPAPRFGRYVSAIRLQGEEKFPHARHPDPLVSLRVGQQVDARVEEVLRWAAVEGEAVDHVDGLERFTGGFVELAEW